MTKNPPSISCPCISGIDQVGVLSGNPLKDSGTPLSRTCGSDRFRICKIGGDRKMCARMAQLGFLPGSELELVCPGQSKPCMVRVKGSTVTLDEMQAENIFVIPA